MTYSVEIIHSARKDLKKLPSQARERIITTLERCRVRPYAHVVKIMGSPYFRIRSGDYRIIVDIKNDVLLILVIEVGHRKSIYK